MEGGEGEDSWRLFWEGRKSDMVMCGPKTDNYTNKRSQIDGEIDMQKYNKEEARRKILKVCDGRPMGF